MKQKPLSAFEYSALLEKKVNDILASPEASQLKGGLARKIRNRLEERLGEIYDNNGDRLFTPDNLNDDIGIILGNQAVEIFRKAFGNALPRMINGAQRGSRVRYPLKKAS